METGKSNNLKVRPDLKTGKLPTAKQLEVLQLLNPFLPEGKPRFKDIAVTLKITPQAVGLRMTNLKRRCPEIYANWHKAYYPNKYKIKKWRYKKYSKGCPGCGFPMPSNQILCYRCWRRIDRQKCNNWKDYKPDPMFPCNGVTPSTVEWDKWEDNDWHRENNCRFSTSPERRGY